jgi:hypothetical protein
MSATMVDRFATRHKPVSRPKLASMRVSGGRAKLLARVDLPLVPFVPILNFEVNRDGSFRHSRHNAW